MDIFNVLCDDEKRRFAGVLRGDGGQMVISRRMRSWPMVMMMSEKMMNGSARSRKRPRQLLLR